jgi:hypothetical protein
MRFRRAGAWRRASRPGGRPPPDKAAAEPGHAASSTCRAMCPEHEQLAAALLCVTSRLRPRRPGISASEKSIEADRRMASVLDSQEHLYTLIEVTRSTSARPSICSLARSAVAASGARFSAATPPAIRTQVKNDPGRATRLGMSAVVRSEGWRIEGAAARPPPLRSLLPDVPPRPTRPQCGGTGLSGPRRGRATITA